jgi:PPOX class probable F420-dependent enzyme
MSLAINERPMTGIPVPESHIDLLTGSVHGVLTTMMPGGQPECSIVWCDYDGECACVNSTLERQKGRNMARNPKVSLLVVDPQDTGRYIEIRGEAEIIETGAIEHLDKLTRRYTEQPRFYGYIYPVEQRARERRIICRIHATRIMLDAIHR